MARPSTVGPLPHDGRASPDDPFLWSTLGSCRWRYFSKAEPIPEALLMMVWISPGCSSDKKAEPPPNRWRGAHVPFAALVEGDKTNVGLHGREPGEDRPDRWVTGQPARSAASPSVALVVG